MSTEQPNEQAVIKLPAREELPLDHADGPLQEQGTSPDVEDSYYEIALEQISQLESSSIGTPEFRSDFCTMLTCLLELVMKDVKARRQLQQQCDELQQRNDELEQRNDEIRIQVDALTQYVLWGDEDSKNFIISHERERAARKALLNGAQPVTAPSRRIGETNDCGEMDKHHSQVATISARS